MPACSPQMVGQPLLTFVPGNADTRQQAIPRTPATHTDKVEFLLLARYAGEKVTIDAFPGTSRPPLKLALLHARPAAVYAFSQTRVVLESPQYRTAGGGSKGRASCAPPKSNGAVPVLLWRLFASTATAGDGCIELAAASELLKQ